MARIAFTSNLQRHLSCPVREIAGGTVRAALDEVFSQHPRLRSYIVDDQDRLRRHVVIFVNSAKIADHIALGDPVGDRDEIFVFQALTGG